MPTGKDEGEPKTPTDPPHRPSADDNATIKVWLTENQDCAEGCLQFYYMQKVAVIPETMVVRSTKPDSNGGFDLTLKFSDLMNLKNELAGCGNQD